MIGGRGRPVQLKVRLRPTGGSSGGRPVAVNVRPLLPAVMTWRCRPTTRTISISNGGSPISGLQLSRVVVASRQLRAVAVALAARSLVVVVSSCRRVRAVRLLEVSDVDVVSPAARGRLVRRLEASEVVVLSLVPRMICPVVDPWVVSLVVVVSAVERIRGAAVLEPLVLSDVDVASAAALARATVRALVSPVVVLSAAVRGWETVLAAESAVVVVSLVVLLVVVPPPPMVANAGELKVPVVNAGPAAGCGPRSS